jgi:hypothetical protein
MTTNSTAEPASPTPIATFSASVHVDASPEVTFAVLAAPRTHLQWAGAQAPDGNFRLLSLDAPDGVGQVGTVFTSTGVNGKGKAARDRSTVTQASAPVFAFGTESELVRKRRPIWRGRFDHRYEVSADGSGSRIDYTAKVFAGNYRPYWLHPFMRPMTRIMVSRMMIRNMRQFAAMAERAAVQTAQAHL